MRWRCTHLVESCLWPGVSSWDVCGRLADYAHIQETTGAQVDLCVRHFPGLSLFDDVSQFFEFVYERVGEVSVRWPT